jgi:ABC-2 type transport system permease protein
MMKRSVRAILAQSRVELALTLRRGENLVVSLAIPVGILVFFAKVEVVQTSLRDPVQFLVPGVLALAVMSSAMVSLGIATGYERRYGVLKRLGSTPLSRAGLLTAKTINVVALEVVQAVVLLGVGAALGWHSEGSVAAAVGLLLLGTVAFAGIGLFFAGLLRAEANLAVANALFLLLLFVGGMAYPLAKLPNALATVARGLPAAALSDTVRQALSTSSVSVGALAVLVGWAIGAPLLAARTFRWEE